MLSSLALQTTNRLSLSAATSQVGRLVSARYLPTLVDYYFDRRRPTAIPQRRYYNAGNLLRKYSAVPLPEDSDSENDFFEPELKKLPNLNLFDIPQRCRRKVVTAEDAVSLINRGDTISVSGFVAQGVPEAVLQALGERYTKTGSPSNLTLLFGGGPGDWGTRGLNHLAKTPCDTTKSTNGEAMLKRTIGSHYGQVPAIGKLALDEVTEAWTLPLGSVSRMLRAQSTHSPGHITSIGIGTFVDPDVSGGAANEAAKKSDFTKELVSKITLGDEEQLMYKALPIDVAIIRGTTADGQGNISIEHESLLCDQLNTAAAAHNSGGIVIAQVKRIAADGSLPMRSVAVPGALVDCVVVVEDKDQDALHPMSFAENYNPVFTGAIQCSLEDQLPRMPLNIRKIIARKALMGLRPNTVVNLGIGLPEGVASVAAEEGILDYVTLSTEPGVFGGVPASGHSFGPSFNASAMVEMNQMFDYYDGGGLDMCFLGAAQVSAKGDVNASRLSKDAMLGPGGFIDISQSTKNIFFMTTLTAKGLEANATEDGKLEITKEGSIKKFVSDVMEKTFSGDEAVRRGQNVFYVTERAVFQRTAKFDVLELVEIAPGVDLQKDILEQVDFKPVVSPNLQTMDSRIFEEAKMNIKSQLFGSLVQRCSYRESDHTLFAELFGITIDNEDDALWFQQSWKKILDPLVKRRGRINVVVNYDGFDVRNGMEDRYAEISAEFEKKYYKSVKRYAGKAFKRAKLEKQLHMEHGDSDSEERYSCP